MPHADAALNAGRAALLVAALTLDPTLLLDATEDRLHQSYRAPAMPRSAALVTKLRGRRGRRRSSPAPARAVLALTRSAELERVISMAPKGFVVHALEVDGGAVAEPYRP